jgi:hypothetical protein
MHFLGRLGGEKFGEVATFIDILAQRRSFALVQAPQQQRHATHQVEKNQASHGLLIPDLSRKIRLSANDRGSIFFIRWRVGKYGDNAPVDRACPRAGKPPPARYGGVTSADDPI